MELKKKEFKLFWLTFSHAGRLASDSARGLGLIEWI